MGTNNNNKNILSPEELLVDALSKNCPSQRYNALLSLVRDWGVETKGNNIWSNWVILLACHIQKGKENVLP